MWMMQSASDRVNVNAERACTTRWNLSILLAGLFALAGCLSPVCIPGEEMTGLASWYGGKFQGRLTASGEVFDTNLLTAAHRTLAFGTLVEVTRVDTGRSVVVRINDRGPFVAGRVIDLSRAAAQELLMTGQGVAPVQLHVVRPPEEATWSVQVASFRVRENAARVAATLAASGLDARLESSAGLFRVVLADIPDSELSGIRGKLAGLGYVDVLARRR